MPQFLRRFLRTTSLVQYLRRFWEERCRFEVQATIYIPILSATMKLFIRRGLRCWFMPMETGMWIRYFSSVILTVFFERERWSHLPFTRRVILVKPIFIYATDSFQAMQKVWHGPALGEITRRIDIPMREILIYSSGFWEEPDFWIADFLFIPMRGMHIRTISILITSWCDGWTIIERGGLPRRVFCD